MSTEQNTDLIKYTKIDQIGEGMFSEVFKIKETETGQIYAAKILCKQLNVNLQDDLLRLSREVNLNAGFDHPTVLKFIEYSPKNFENKPFPVIITEYAANGTLSRIIDLERQSLSGNIWTKTKKLINIYGIASGMSYLHANKIIHRDLKPDNILMDDMLFPKISDFGLSKRLHSDKSMTVESRIGFKGTPRYAAPELFANKEQTEASDVYAFALIVYEILTAKIPYEEDEMLQLIMKVANGVRPPFDVPIDEPYQNLIERCWSQDPKDRPTFAQIVEELENDESFITKSIKHDDFLNYVKFINDYKKCFNDKKIIKLDDFIHNKASNTFKRIDIRRYIEEQQDQNLFGRLFKTEKLYPAADLVKLNDDCKYLVIQAENDAEKQFYIGTYLIEGKNGFPIKIDLGVKYLERSISGKYIESAFYLSMMLFEGKIIPKDLKKAKKYLTKHLNSKDIRVLVLYARILYKEGNFKESRKYFEKCAKEGDFYSMYKYAQMLFCGYGGSKSIDDARFYFNLSKDNGFQKSELYVTALLQYEKDEEFCNLPTETQNFLIKQIIKYNTIQEDSRISFSLTKIYMKYKVTQMLFANKSLESKDFNMMMSHFNEIAAEILFPSKQFKLILNLVSHMKPNVNISVVVSGVSSISNKLGPDKLIKQIKIDDSVKRIESSSFKDCSALIEITIPPSVILIGDDAFSHCKSLTEIAIPSSVTKIGASAFIGCLSLTEIAIHSPVTSIEEDSFYDCCKLKRITIPSSVKFIKSQAFGHCTSLEQITVSPSLVSIDYCSFNFCRNLKEITIPSSVISIGNRAFYWCSSLEQITIPSSVKSIGEFAFYHCHSITCVSFQSPSAITSIQTSTFEMCASLTEITIPHSVGLIDHFAFKNCKNLKEVTFLNQPKKIESDAFAGCSLLKDIPVTESGIVFKAVIIGGRCAGKTCILDRYFSHEFPNNTNHTIGINFSTKNLNISGNEVNLQIYDTSGLEAYHDIIRYQYISIDFAIVVIDLSYYDSFDYSIRLFKEIREEVGQIPVVLLGNKCDLDKDIRVTQELEKFQKEYNIKYFEVSAKDNINIEESIQYIVTETFNSYFC